MKETGDNAGGYKDIEGDRVNERDRG